MFTASSVSTLRRIWGHEEKDVSRERKKRGGGWGWEFFPHSDNALFEDIDKILRRDGEEGIRIRKTLKS